MSGKDFKTTKHHQRQQKLFAGDWTDVSVVNSIDGSSKGPGLNSQYPYVDKIPIQKIKIKSPKP